MYLEKVTSCDIVNKENGFETVQTVRNSGGAFFCKWWNFSTVKKIMQKRVKTGTVQSSGGHLHQNFDAVNLRLIIFPSNEWIFRFTSYFHTLKRPYIKCEKAVQPI